MTSVVFQKELQTATTFSNKIVAVKYSEVTIHKMPLIVSQIQIPYAW